MKVGNKSEQHNGPNVGVTHLAVGWGGGSTVVKVSLKRSNQNSRTVHVTDPSLSLTRQVDCVPIVHILHRTSEHGRTVAGQLPGNVTKRYLNPHDSGQRPAADELVIGLAGHCVRICFVATHSLVQIILILKKIC